MGSITKLVAQLFDIRAPNAFDKVPRNVAIAVLIGFPVALFPVRQFRVNDPELIDYGPEIGFQRFKPADEINDNIPVPIRNGVPLHRNFSA